MEMLEKQGIGSLSNMVEKDFESAPEYGIGGELRKAFKKLGPAIGATIGAVIGGLPGAAIGAGIGTKTSASDNYAQNMLLAAGLAGGFGAKGQGFGATFSNPGQAFSSAFANVGDSTLGSLLGIGEKSSALDKILKDEGYTKVKGGYKKSDAFISDIGANQLFGEKAQAAAEAAKVAGDKTVLDRIKGGIGSLEEFAEENPLTTQLGTQLIFPKLVEAIYGKDPYGTEGRFSFADQGLRPGVNPLQNNPYIQGSVVNTPQFPNLRNFVGANRAMFGGKIGYKDGGPKLDAMMVRPDGEIRGPGTPTSDDIPVYLSDQEYVLPKVMVDYLGGGDYEQGIANLEQIRTKLV
tara:strand:- start:1608 stop:2654 length:1047 start_codon:yes stop_codon:yes gene_type:complete